MSQAPADQVAQLTCSLAPAPDADEHGAVLTPYPDGPLLLRGDFVITTVDGDPVPAGRKTVALCRCGRSAIKPFCDGSHVRAGFRARDRFPDRGQDAASTDEVAARRAR